MDEALYLQRQQELQRDFQLRQMLLQEQIDHQSRIDSMLHEHQVKAIEHLHDFPDLQHYSRFLLNEQLQRQDERSLLARERAQLLQHEELRRRQALAQQGQSSVQLGASTQPHELSRGHAAVATKVPSSAAAAAAGSTKSAASGAAAKAALLRDLAADSLAGNAVKRSDLDKRVFAKGDEADEAPAPAAAKKRPRSGTHESAELDKKQKAKKPKPASPKKPKKPMPQPQLPHEPKRAPTIGDAIGASAVASIPKPTPSARISSDTASTMKSSAQALLDFVEISKKNSPLRKSSPPKALPHPPNTPQEHRPVQDEEEQAAAAALTEMPSPVPAPIITLGTIGDLVTAGKETKKFDDAADVLMGIKKNVEWPDSDAEEEARAQQEKEEEAVEAAKREIEIALEKGDTIQLPRFTSILPQLPEEPEMVEESGGGKKKKKKRFRSILDEDSMDSKRNGEKKSSAKPPLLEAPASSKRELSVIEYPYPIDTWWPSVASVRRERKIVGEPQDEDTFIDDPEIPGPNSEFRMNMDKVKDSFCREVTPGVLEKIPHCKIHRMLMKKRKNPSAPELVFCFQVTELYPNDVMVCCSHCGTWRHTACGGHHKPYSIRECIDTPFNAVCDRCHEEEKVLRDNPVARRRIERQRTEQIRRALSTSAAMRQASFSKHGGTYKWPLGSVSATHIGGHTRSVHSRHDKAEKQWTDMANKLSRSSYRPKERVKVRTKELERLLVSVEDAGTSFCKKKS